MNKYKVNSKCISCKACVRVAGNNFKIDNKAVVFKQPENEKELENCETALRVCPTDAIEIIKNNPILGENKVKETLEKYPELKLSLKELSIKFKNFENPVMWNTVAKFATFKDAAKMTGVSLCEILHTINSELGTEKELEEQFPNCIKENIKFEINNSIDIYWNEPKIIYNINDDDSEGIEELVEKIKNLKEDNSIVFESNSIIHPVVKIVEDFKLTYNLLRINPQKIRISIYKGKSKDWKEIKDTFEQLDVRKMKNDPFDIIIKKAYSVNEDSGFILIQTFVPDPMLNMLSEMGFEYIVEPKDSNEVWVYLHKIKREKTNHENENEKPSIVIQSATPVGYPIIMKLLQSKRISDAVSIKELKVWDETEKHLGWIADGRADISFSSVITASKLKTSDVIMPIVFVWDNFSILTNNYEATSLNDIKGKTISVPLFEDAPPAKITKYLIESKGYNVNEFNLTYGNPFGRPNEIMQDFISEKVDTVLLREPEASFALKGAKDKGLLTSELSYGKIFNEITEGFGLFPNAGVVIKGEFARNHPEIVKILDEEVKKAIEWVNENRKEAAKLSFDMMRQDIESVELFLDRVTFKYMAGEELVKKVKTFYQLLIDNGIVKTEIDEELLSMFR